MLKTISEPILERMDVSNARVEDKLEALKEVLDERLKSQNAKYNILLWVIGVGFTLLLAFSFFGEIG